MQKETDRQGVDGVRQGQGGGRVYAVRNVDTDTRDWTGRVMLGNTLGRNRHDARVLHIPPTLQTPRKVTFSHYFHTTGLQVFKRQQLSSLAD